MTMIWTQPHVSGWASCTTVVLGNAVFGVEIANRVGLSDLLFRDTTTKPSDSVMLSLMEQAGGPVLGVASRSGTWPEIDQRGIH